MGEAHLSGPRAARPATDQGGDRRRVVRRPEGRHPHESGARSEDARHRVDPGHREGGLVAEQRQQPGEAARKHRLAGARRPGQQQVVGARGGDLERPPGPLLAAHVREVRHLGERLEVVGRRRQRRRVAFAAQVGDGVGEVADADRLDAGERDLRPRFRGTDEVSQPRTAGALRRDERPGHGPQATVQRQLTERGVPFQGRTRELVGRSKQRKRDRQVEAGAFLAQGGRGEIDRDAPHGRPLELGGGDPRADALLRLLAGAVGEPDDRERVDPPLQVCFDLDAARVDADECMRDGASEHVATLDDEPRRRCDEIVPAV